MASKSTSPRKTSTVSTKDVSETAEKWAAELEVLGVTPEDLDDLVHDHADASSKGCSDINNMGMSYQIDALIKALGEPGAVQAIRELNDVPWGRETTQKTEILLHTVQFWYDGGFTPAELPETEVEHIQGLIKQGCSEGELCYYHGEHNGKDVEFRGYWNIAKEKAAEAVQDTPKPPAAGLRGQAAATAAASQSNPAATSNLVKACEAALEWWHANPRNFERHEPSWVQQTRNAIADAAAPVKATKKQPGEDFIAGETKDGRKVYFCLDYKNDTTRSMIFTLRPKGIRGEARNETTDQFDARDVPDKYILKDKQPVDWVIAALEGGWGPQRVKLPR